MFTSDSNDIPDLAKEHIGLCAVAHSILGMFLIGKLEDRKPCTLQPFLYKEIDRRVSIIFLRRKLTIPHELQSQWVSEYVDFVTINTILPTKTNAQKE